MIESLKLKNFTAFSSLEMKFSPRINVIIGENSTGKTNILKASYACCSGNSGFIKDNEFRKNEFEEIFTKKLQRLFLPIDDKIGKLHHYGASEQAQIEAIFVKDRKLLVSFFNNSKAVSMQQNYDYNHYKDEPVFFPTKEVLSFMKGFSSLYDKYELSFDQTYKDICILLDLPEIRPEKLHVKSKWAIKEIETICGGRFIFYGGGKVTFKSENNEFSANSMAEGFRKVGMLSRLLETGAIQPGVSGPLFWDEPEANMNPKLMKMLVQVLLELSRYGQQIILATHDYVLLKWFDLLIDKEKGDQVLFHTLSRNTESGEIKLESFSDYRSISKNTITDTYNDLLQEQVNLSMGGLGK